MSLAYAEQLARKQKELATLFDIDVPPIVPSPRQSAFRQKAAFVFGSSRGRGLVMGHYAAGSRHIVPIDECPVHSTRANRIAFALRDRLARANITAADRPGGLLRHLIVRTTEDDKEAVAMLVVTHNDKSLRAPVRGLLASADAPDGFFININRRSGPQMVGEETIKIAGRSHVREKGISGLAGDVAASFLVSPDAFFQTNVGAARELVKLVLEGIGPARRVLDLYCGSGLFAIPLAFSHAGALSHPGAFAPSHPGALAPSHPRQVTAVEENRQAIDGLKANVRLNRIPADQIVPIAARVEDAIARLSRSTWDAVVLDPPRDGCEPGALQAIVDRIAPPRIVYVSCNPEALAGELPILLNARYCIDRVVGVDMFPHTDHIEVVMTLSRR